MNFQSFTRVSAQRLRSVCAAAHDRYVELRRQRVVREYNAWRVDWWCGPLWWSRKDWPELLPDAPQCCDTLLRWENSYGDASWAFSAYTHEFAHLDKLQDLTLASSDYVYLTAEDLSVFDDSELSSLRETAS